MGWWGWMGFSFPGFKHPSVCCITNSARRMQVHFLPCHHPSLKPREKLTVPGSSGDGGIDPSFPPASEPVGHEPLDLFDRPLIKYRIADTPSLADHLHLQL